MPMFCCLHLQGGIYSFRNSFDYVKNLQRGDNDLERRRDTEVILILAKGKKWTKMVNKTALIRAILIYHHRREMKL
jgi:hypothetical protein